MKKTILVLVVSMVSSLSSFAATTPIFCRAVYDGAKEIVIKEGLLKTQDNGVVNGFEAYFSTKGLVPNEKYYAQVSFEPIINTITRSGAKFFVNMIVGLKFYRQDNDQPYSDKDFDHLGSARGRWNDLNHMMLLYDAGNNLPATIWNVQLECRESNGQ